MGEPRPSRPLPGVGHPLRNRHSTPPRVCRVILDSSYSIGRFLSPNRIPHRLSSQIRSNDNPPNEDVPTPLTLENPRPDRLLLREVVE